MINLNIKIIYTMFTIIIMDSGSGKIAAQKLIKYLKNFEHEIAV